MRIGVAADHGGLALKEQIVTALRNEGHTIIDFGATQLDWADDYPDFVVPMAQAVSRHEVERGIAICGSGVGASIAANKVSGVRAGLCADCYSAHQGVEHDSMNVLCLGARVIGPSLALDLAQAFLKAEFTHEERHKRRLAKIDKLESR
ncbi:MAG: RpiB/LacA/LacB family sugar-phosphate isomerase [Candidatus Binatia bacterium]